MAYGLTRQQIVMLVIMIFGTFVTVLNQTVVTPAQPSIMAEMGIDASTVQWLTTGFTLVNAIMIPVTAYLTDKHSTKMLYLVSMGIFAVGSLMAGIAPDFAVLLIGRLLQAAGAGILMPMVMTVLMLLWNYIITPLYMHTARADVAAMLVPVFLPFNAVKGGLNLTATLLLYKPVVGALRKAKLIPESTSCRDCAMRTCCRRAKRPAACRSSAVWPCGSARWPFWPCASCSF